MNSILTSIKKLLGIAKEYEAFDEDIVLYINSVFSILCQLGVGPSSGYSITNQYNEWTDYLPPSPRLEFVKTYMHLKVRMMFDPPTNPTVSESIGRMINELEWRILSTMESTV